MGNMSEYSLHRRVLNRLHEWESFRFSRSSSATTKTIHNS